MASCARYLCAVSFLLEGASARCNDDTSGEERQVWRIIMHRRMTCAELKRVSSAMSSWNCDARVVIAELGGATQQRRSPPQSSSKLLRRVTKQLQLLTKKKKKLEDAKYEESAKKINYQTII